MIVDDITVPAQRFPGLTESASASGPSTIYNLYQDVYGISVVRSSERLRAVARRRRDRALLGIAPGAPLLQIRRIALAYNDLPVEFRISQVNTARYEYFSDLGAQLSDAGAGEGQKREPQLRHRREAAPMRGTRSVPRQRREMLRRAVALVLREAVAGVPAVELDQQRVARGLGEDRRRRDRRDVAVALDDRARRRRRAPGQRLPSTSASPGATASPSTARRIASSVACRMLSASISATSASRDRPRERARADLDGERARAAAPSAPSNRAGRRSAAPDRGSPPRRRRVRRAARAPPRRCRRSAHGPRPRCAVVSEATPRRRAARRATASAASAAGVRRQRRRRIRRTAPRAAAASPCRRRG